MVTTARPAIGVLALQGGVAEHLAALERSGAEARPVRRPEELAAVDGLVLPGGESTAMTRLLDSSGLREPLEDRLASGMPAFGSCAGMVLLARDVVDGQEEAGGQPAVRPFGALDVVVRRNAFGRQVDSFETELEFAGLGPVHAVFIRAPWVDKTGDGVEVLARVPEAPDGAGQQEAAGRIVAVQQGPVLAVAFHPELVSGGERVHRHFVQIVRAH
ncbi:MAG: pyridoxal 5'-phosphate synthase glutaminase subunit PdxT [Saccharopolyspora rectivirgula]|uniref:pyridoxal 5'-phosphate synthase glutaminase subunit PdxT n=1 Tax=Saccharopolyspora rectivirgula TaxID=28042 RepID=UPI0024095097|nr:pyridoxal 5'-phosphate synthase glutaminase subunit PdxT [Saccharopolyspora rectivirgula]